MTTGAAQPPQPPEPISWTDLIAAGRRALTPEPPATHPTQAAVRRAVSDAYYAAFHALAASNADTLIGVAQDQLTTGAWVRVYRGLDHGRARAQLHQHRSSLSPQGQAFAQLFRNLQNERRLQSADYNPQAYFTPQTAANWLDNAETTTSDFLQTDRSERAHVAALTLVRER